jgi:hypothetical protein
VGGILHAYSGPHPVLKTLAGERPDVCRAHGTAAAARGLKPC